MKRQERDNPVLILEPGKEYEREDGSIGTYYNAKKLYEPSQTSLRNYTQEKPQVTEQQLIRALLSNPPVNIVPAEPDQMPEGKGALFAPDERCIYVRKGMDAQSIFLSLSPELALAGFADGKKSDGTPAATRGISSAERRCEIEQRTKGAKKRMRKRKFRMGGEDICMRKK